jgi:hypothetical protein
MMHFFISTPLNEKELADKYGPSAFGEENKWRRRERN